MKYPVPTLTSSNSRANRATDMSATWRKSIFRADMLSRFLKK